MAGRLAKVMPPVIAYVAAVFVSIGFSAAVAGYVATVLVSFALGSLSFERDGITYDLIGRDE